MRLRKIPEPADRTTERFDRLSTSDLQDYVEGTFSRLHQHLLTFNRHRGTDNLGFAARDAHELTILLQALHKRLDPE